MKRFLLSIAFFSIFVCSCSAKAKTNDAVVLVKSYINDMGANILAGKDSHEKFLNPDSEYLGGDRFNYVVVTSDFTVKKVVEKTENIDDLHPKNEKIVEVTIAFEKIGQFDEKSFIAKREPYERTYYCSKSTGKYLILDDTDSETMLCFSDAAVKWLERKAEEDGSWSNALASLKSAMQGNGAGN